MYNKNNGKTESEILQNEFTSYFQTAIRNYKKKRLEKETVRDRHIIITDEPGQYRQQKETNIFEQSAYLKDLFGDEALIFALSQLSEREREILMLRAVQEASYDSIAAKFGIGYKGVSAVYYRALHKLRGILQSEVDEN